MNKILNIIISIMLFCTYQLFALELTQAEKAWISEHPVIRLGIGKAWAPFIYPKANGKHEGFDIDLISLINKRTGLNIEIVPGKWNEMVRMAQNREIDGLAESTANESRKQFFNFSESYLTQYYALATTPDKIDRIRSEADLEGKTLALLKGNLWLNNLVKSIGNVKTIETNTEIEAFNKVVEGKADASFMSLGMFSEYRKTFFENIVISHIFNDDEQKMELLYSIRKDWPELVAILDKAINDISQEEKTILYKKWFGFSADAFESQTWLQLTEAEKAWLKEHPVIRIAPDPDFPPIEWFDEENKYQGITADFMNLIADALDIEFEVVQCESWDEVLQKAKSREIDMLPAAAQTPDRAEYMLFSDPHLIFQGVIITTKNNQDLNSTERLYGKKVGIVSGYVWNEFISKGHPEINIISVANIVEGLRKVSTGEIDAFIGTLPIALYYIEKEGIPNLVIAGETGYETKLSIQTRKDWPLLNSIMTKTLKAIPPAKKKEIINKWISLKPMSVYSYRIFWILVLVISGSSLMIVVVIVGWNKILKKQVEIKTKELKENEKRYKKAQSLGRVGNWEYDVESTKFWASDESKRIFGLNLNSQSFTTEEVENCIPDRIRVHQALIDLIENNKEYNLEFDIITHDTGKRRTIQSVAVLEKNKLGEPGKVTGVIKDITEQKRIEMEIQKSSNIINRSNSVAFRWLNDGNWTVDFVTDNIVNLCGYKSEDFYKKIVIYKDIVHSDDLERIRIEFKKYNELEHDQGFQHSYYRIVTRNGKVKWISDNTFVSRGSNGQITHYDGIVTDVTDIVVAKEAVEESERKFKSYTENAPEGIFIVNEEGFYQDVNPEASKQTGYSKEELLGMHISQMVPKEELKLDQEKFFYLKKNNFMQNETQHITKDGSIKYWKLSAVKLSESRYMGFTQDITEIKKKEDELKLFRDNLEQLVKERTSELEEKNAKLEKFNKLFVDREFRIKELKEEIERLSK